MQEIIDIWVNCPDEATADKIAEALLERRLIACANRLAAVESRYRWQGVQETEREIPLLMKTRADLFDAVERAVCHVHPYDVPAIIGVPVARVNEAYASWVFNETGPA